MKRRLHVVTMASVVTIVCVLAAALVIPGLAPAAAQTMPDARIAIIDYQLIRQKSVAMIDINSQIERRRQIYQEEISLQEQELRDEDQELVRQRSILAADAFAQKRREFEARVAEVQRVVQARKKELDMAYEYGLKQIQAAVINIIAELSEIHGFNLVLSRQQIVFADSALNISEEGLRRLNERLPRVEVSAAQN